MSDQAHDPGWWLASDGQWYPPQTSTPTKPPTQKKAISTRKKVIGAVGGVLVLLLVISGIAGAGKKKTLTVASSTTSRSTTTRSPAVTTVTTSVAAIVPSSPAATAATAATAIAPSAATPATAADGSVIPTPDPTLTPGATFAAVTKDQICVSGYATSVRNVTSAEKAQVFVRYQIPDVPNTYEVDHLISLELGGSNDITNLWPEPLAGPYGALAKDKVENSLHGAVCAGRLALTDAQRLVAASWWTWQPSAGLNAPAPVAVPPAAPLPTTTVAPNPPPPASVPSGPSDQGVVHAGSYCSTDGATGHTSTGIPMVCTTAQTDSRDRWRRA